MAGDTRASDPRPQPPRRARADFFAFRVPALPAETLTCWAEGVEAPTASPDDLEAALERDRLTLTQRLKTIASRRDVQSAIAVASPDLFDAVSANAGEAKVEASLIRYVTRMATRPTPFGLFAACGTGRIGRCTGITVPPRSDWRRHTRLDGDYLDRVLQSRARALRASLAFCPNASLYRAGPRWRYVVTRLEKLERTHHVAEVPDSPHLLGALDAAVHGAEPARIAGAVASSGVAVDSAVRYVDELIEAQVLVPAMALSLTGALPLDALIDDLEGTGDAETAAALRGVRAQLASIDAEGLTASPRRHAEITAMLDGLPEPASRATLLQVDATIPALGATLSTSAVDDAVRAVELLRRISAPRAASELGRFRVAFAERYEEREVPLLEALDDDLGPGFGGGSNPAPLVKGLASPPVETASFGRRERGLLSLLHRAWTGNSLEVALEAADIDALERAAPPPLPAAFHLMATIARTAGGERLVLDAALGPSGATFLGRFCHADPELLHQVRRHVQEEEALDPDAMYAEIVHLPSGRLSNVLVRPVLRSWELTWLGCSGAPTDRVIPASDLLVSVRHGRFVLRSRRWNRRVVPRLTSAHNWSRRSPGVYRFLAALQSEGAMGSVAWSWGPLAGAPFTPRVRWGRVILALATWRLDREQARSLELRDPLARWRAVQAWRRERRLPRWAQLVEGDNRLVVDFDNTLSVDTFVRELRDRDDAVVQEWYPAPDQMIVDGADGHRALELVIPVIRQSTATPDPAPPAPVSHARVRATGVRRTFPPGSEWSYVKLYSGLASADTLLREDVGPLARRLIGSGGADRWFFIRYADPRPHLRVRFHGDPHGLQEPLHQLAGRVLDAGLAHDVELATYHREIERYGGAAGIELAEQIFHADSDAVEALLQMFEPGERGLDERWRIGALGSDLLMRDLGLDEETRARQARSVFRSFERELGAAGRPPKAVAQRVREHEAAVTALLFEEQGTSPALRPGIEVLRQRSARLVPLVADLERLQSDGLMERTMEDLAESLVHMWLNRLCRSENRFHEYVTYGLLARALQARVARRQAAGHLQRERAR